MKKAIYTSKIIYIISISLVVIMASVNIWRLISTPSLINIIPVLILLGVFYLIWARLWLGKIILQLLFGLIAIALGGNFYLSQTQITLETIETNAVAYLIVNIILIGLICYLYFLTKTVKKKTAPN